MPVCETSPLTIVREELSAYCKRTTLRVLPRLATAGTSLSAFLWFSLFVCFFGLAVILVRDQLGEYLTRSYFLRSSLIGSEEIPFPSLTLCPQDPLVRKVLVEELIPLNLTPSYVDRAYQERVNGKDTSYDYSLPYPGMSSFYDLLRSTNETLFFRALVSRSDLIFGCYMDISNTPRQKYFVSNWKKCSEERLQMRIIYIPKHIFCVSLIVNDNFRLSTAAVRLYFNLGQRDLKKDPISDEDVTKCSGSIHWDPATWHSGIRIFVHQARAFPDLNVGFDLSGGRIYDANYEARSEDLSGVRCGDELADIEDRRSSFGYSRQMCYLQQAQKLLKQRCGCIDSNFPVDDDSGSVNFCGLSSNSNVSDQEFHCRRGALKNIDFHTFQRDCPARCKSLKYNFITRSNSRIRHDAVPTLLRLLIRANTSDQAAARAHIQQIEAAAAAEDLKTTANLLGDVRERFVVLTVRLGELRHNLDLGVYKITFDDLLSRVGGACGLCLGFTIFAIVEIFELLLFIGLRCLPGHHLVRLQRWFGVLPTRMYNSQIAHLTIKRRAFRRKT